MLTVQSNQDNSKNKKTNYDSFLSYMFGNLGSMLNLITKIQGNIKAKPFKYTDWYWFYDVTMDSEVLDDANIVEITHKHREKLYSFELPIYFNLKDDSTDIAKITKEHKVANKSLFMTYIYSRAAMISVGVGSIINLAFLGVSLSKVGYAHYSMFGSSIIASGVGMVASVLYLVPVIFKYYANKFLLKKLENTLDTAVSEINSNKMYEASQKLLDLNILYQIILHPMFPNNIEMRFKYNYILGVSLNNDVYLDDAIMLAVNSDQHFLVLRALCNSTDIFYNERIKEIKSKPYLSESSKQKQDSQVVTLLDSKSKAIQKYINQVPRDSELHKCLGISLHGKVSSCFESICEYDLAAANDKFNNIEFDGYCEEAYPATMIMYYQIQSILLLTSEHDNSHWSKGMITLERLEFTLFNLRKVQKYIDSSFNHKAEEHQSYIDSFERMSLERATAPIPEFCSSITPMAKNYMNNSSSASSSINESEHTMSSRLRLTN